MIERDPKHRLFGSRHFVYSFGAKPLGKPRECVAVSSAGASQIDGGRARRADNPVPKNPFARQFADMTKNAQIRVLHDLMGDCGIAFGERETVTRESLIPLGMQKPKGLFVPGAERARQARRIVKGKWGGCGR